MKNIFFKKTLKEKNVVVSKRGHEEIRKVVLFITG